MKFLAIKNYRKHQHYHKRGAPWIKLYSSVLTNPDFIQLPEAAQAQLMKLWVLASQFGHPLPNNPKLLAGKIGTTGKFHLATLIASGFVIPCEADGDESCEQNASNALAESSSASTTTERELERELETALLLPPADAEAEAGLATLLESDADRNALTVVVARATDRLACLTALTSMLTGNDPATPRPTPRVFGQALRDLATNGERITARKFRNYLVEAARMTSAPSGPPSGASAPAVPGARREKTTVRDTGRATLVLGQIKGLMQETRIPGQATARMIPKREVEALGPDVLAAYEAVGGAERVLNTEGDKMTWLIKEFASALDSAEAAHV